MTAEIPEIVFRQGQGRDFGIEVVELSALQKRLGELDHDPRQPHRVRFFMLVCVTAGAGAHTIDFQAYPFTAGSFIFVQKGQVHAFDLTQAPEGKMLLFTDAFIDRVLSQMRLPTFAPSHLSLAYQPIVTPSAQSRQRTSGLLAEIETELALPNGDPLIVMHLFCSLFLTLRRETAEDRAVLLNKEQMGRFSHFLHLLESHIHETRDAVFYADRLNVTYKTLNALCKKAAQQTAKQLIDSYMILEAKRRLVSEGRNAQQLSFDLGFEDPSNFVKYFKKHTLMTPAKFQKQYKG